LSEAASHAGRAGVALTHLDYRAAANDFAAAAALAERWGPQELAWRYRIYAAESLRTLGEQFVDNAALVEAIETYGQALKLAPREQRPLDWARSENRLAAAMSVLGQRESTTTRLEQAIALLHEALKEQTRERVPLDWAATQAGLGTPLLDWASVTAGLPSSRRRSPPIARRSKK
jgi:tetratricopeptide (TPR) repeat protein